MPDGLEPIRHTRSYLPVQASIADSARNRLAAQRAEAQPLRGRLTAKGGGCSAVERVLQPVGGGRERLVRGRRIDRHELTVGARVAAEEGQFECRSGDALPRFGHPGFADVAAQGDGAQVEVWG